MRSGEPVEGTGFFDLLYEDPGFCEQLGRAVLAAGRLEAELKLFLVARKIEDDTERATLGFLISILKRKGLLERMQPVLDMLKDQRNYLAHNIYALFCGLIEETMLQRSELLDSDVDMFAEKAWQLARNLDGMSEIISKGRSSTL